MNSRQRQFDFASQYPAKRSGLPFFAHKFIRYLYRRGVASVLHRDAIILLTLIVLTEDQVRYSRPVGFWQSELTAMTGMTSARIADITKLCEQRGWLAYCPGAKGVQGTYFVRVPGGDELAMGDAPLGQDHDVTLTIGIEQEFTTEARRHGDRKHERVQDSDFRRGDVENDADQVQNPEAGDWLAGLRSVSVASVSGPSAVRKKHRKGQSEEPRMNGSTSVPPCLRGESSSPSPSAIATDSRYAPLIQQLKRCGVKGAASCIAKSLKLIELNQLSAVVAYHISRGITPAATPHDPQPSTLLPYDAGLLVERLTNADYASLPPSEGWSEKLINPKWAKARDLAAELDRRRKELEQSNAEQRAKADAITAQRVKAQQLELQFGDMLNELARRDPSYLWGLVAGFNESLATWGRSPKNPQGLASPLIRNRLLDMAAAGKVFFVTGH